MRAMRGPFAFLTVVLLACGDLSVVGTGPDGSVAGPDAEFQVSVQFLHWWPPSWPPGSYVYTWNVGDASRVSVARLTEPAEIVWEIVEASASGIRSGVWHGQIPHGSVATVTAEPVLLPGEGATYRVSVTLRRDGQTRFADFTAASADGLPPS
jgi:hypothetical protein